MFRLWISILCCGTLILQHVQGQNISNLIRTFGEQLESLMCDGYRLGGDKCFNDKYGVQDFIFSLDPYFDRDESDASDLAQNIIDRLDNKLNQRASFLLNLSDAIRSSCVMYDRLTEFDSLYFAGNEDRDAVLPKNMTYSEVYSGNVSLTHSTYKLPNGVEITDNIERDAQVSQLLDTQMRTLYLDHCADIHSDGSDEYCTMYFASVNGLFRQFPGVENAKNDDGSYTDYDPRFKPWYVSSATGSDSKNVVILLDLSGSMRQYNRLSLAKEAVISVLNTLSSSSFVNVIGFSDELSLSCFETNLVAATSSNVAELVEFVDGLEASGLTDFNVAFDAAFDMLQNTEHCQSVILFLTDGLSSNVSDLIIERNVDIGAVVFSFTLGDSADATQPRKVAQITGGVYTHIDDGDENLITVMSLYYLYFAYDHYGGNSSDIIITSPYLDLDTSVVMITMALPVYINRTYFVGVVATDIPLSVLSDAIGDITIGRKSYTFGEEPNWKDV